MASRLTPYPGSAQYPEKKITRAIQSVLDQSYKDFELIIIADGCESTKEIVTTKFTDKRLVLLECKHKAIFDNTPRNTGIDNAKGEFIIYIDIDDFWGEDHLSIIEKQLNDYDWVWYNDIIFSESWIERACNIKTLGGCGTSNVCYKRSLNLKWQRPGYAHDFYFNQQLLRFPNHAKIETPEYFVCHIPNNYDK
jgi:glycosyltransferase involved in cell wall biosynthesis